MAGFPDWSYLLREARWKAGCDARSVEGVVAPTKNGDVSAWGTDHRQHGHLPDGEVPLTKNEDPERNTQCMFWYGASK